MHVIESATPAQACIIWLHGLGANASDMAGLVEQMPMPSTRLRHVCLDAPVRPVTLNGGMLMPAWYDIIGMTLTDREDEKGIIASERQILEAIDKQVGEGFEHGQIFLAGFSQGGAMALYTGLHMLKPLAGVISLSAYLPLLSSIDLQQQKQLPVFIASGKFDPVVLPEWTHFSAQWIKNQGYSQLATHQYDMEHSVCMEEINDLSRWLDQQLCLTA